VPVPLAPFRFCVLSGRTRRVAEISDLQPRGSCRCLPEPLGGSHVGILSMPNHLAPLARLSSQPIRHPQLTRLGTPVGLISRWRQCFSGCCLWQQAWGLALLRSCAGAPQREHCHDSTGRGWIAKFAFVREICEILV